MVMTTVLLACSPRLSFYDRSDVAGVGGGLYHHSDLLLAGHPSYGSHGRGAAPQCHQHELRVLQLHPLQAGQLQDRNTHYHPCGYLFSPRRLLHRYFPKNMLILIFVSFLVFAGSMMLFYRQRKRERRRSARKGIENGYWRRDRPGISEDCSAWEEEILSSPPSYGWDLIRKRPRQRLPSS